LDYYKKYEHREFYTQKILDTMEVLKKEDIDERKNKDYLFGVQKFSLMLILINYLRLASSMLSSNLQNIPKIYRGSHKMYIS